MKTVYGVEVNIIHGVILNILAMVEERHLYFSKLAILEYFKSDNFARKENIQTRLSIKRAQHSRSLNISSKRKLHKAKLIQK